MINLLSPDDLKQISAARLNVKLRKYLIMAILAFAVITGIYGVGYKYARNDFVAAQSKNTAALSDLKQYDDTKQQAADFRTNLGVAKKILGSEIMFSEFITDIAKTLPSGSVLSGLDLTTKQTSSTSKAKGSTQISVRAKSYDGIIAVKSAFERSELFSDVKITSTTNSSGAKQEGIAANYPYEATLSLVINELGGKK